VQALFPIEGGVALATPAAIGKSLSVRPRRSTFARFSASDLCAVTRRFALWVPLLVFGVVTCVIMWSLHQETVFSSGESASMPVLDELAPSCPDSIPDGCWLGGTATALDGLHRRDQVTNVVMSIVKQIFPVDPRVGAAIVGAVTVRTAPPKGAADQEIPALQHPHCGLVPCAALNLSDSVTETALPVTFDCSSIGRPLSDR